MGRLFRGLFPLHLVAAGDRRWLLLMWVVGALQGFAQAPLSTLVPYTRVTLGLSAGAMSLVLAVTRLASLGSIGFSWWADRSGRRRPFLGAYLVLAVASGLTALSVTPLQFTLTQALARVGTTAVGTLAVVLITEGLDRRVRAFAVGLYAAAASLGAGIGQLMLPIADARPEGWRFAFALPLVGLLAVPWLRSIRESPLVDPSNRVAVPLSSLLVGLHRRRFWVAGSAALLAASFPAVGLAFTTERLVNELGMTAGQATTIALTAGTLGGSGFWIGGRLADEWGRKPTTILSLAAATVGGLVLYAGDDPRVVFAALAVGGFGSFAYVPAASTHRAELFPTDVRATGGTGNAYLATVGSAAGLTTGALTIDRIGLFGTMSLLAIPMVLAAILTLLLPETRDQALDSTNSRR